MTDYLVYNSYLVGFDECLKDESKSTKKLEKLKLSDLSGAFLILSVGLIISKFVFFMEIVVRRTGKKITPSEKSERPI